MTEALAKNLLAGDRRALGKAITLIESTRPDHRDSANRLLDIILDKTGKSIRLGISGTPGVGKSTFIEALGKKVISDGHKLAVLAVDPSSPIGSGSILGDKTRMQDLSANPDAFIRPSPSKGHLGGVASRTRETILLCEAAGYDFIMVETVGVGQSEYLVQSMVDSFVFLQLPNSGDQLQGIKKGILELADLILVNKSDGKNVHAAKRAKVDLDLALNLIYQSRPEEKPEVLLISALELLGLDEALSSIYKSIAERKSDGSFDKKRQSQAVSWFEEDVKAAILKAALERPALQSLYKKELNKVSQLKASARQAVHEFTSAMKKEFNHA